MVHGRCAGCGKVDASCKKIQGHVIDCPQYTALYKSDPAKALSPPEEFIRWKAEEGGPEQKEKDKSERLTKLFAKLDADRQKQVDRFKKPKDILDD